MQPLSSKVLAAGIILIFLKDSPVSACARSLLALDPEMAVWSLYGRYGARSAYYEQSDSNDILALSSSSSVILRSIWRPPVEVARKFGFAEDIRNHVEAEKATTSCLMTK